MPKKIFVGVALLCLFAPISAAQVRRPPNESDCPDPDSMVCQLWPHLCEDCEDEPGSFHRVAPIARLDIPRRIGVTALANDGGFNGLWGGGEALYPNWIAADEIVGAGISAVQLWPMVSLTDEPGWPPVATTGELDMTRVFENAGLDLIIVRPMQHSFSELACDGTRAAVWSGGGDWGEYAEDLYSKFGHLNKAIVLTNWESDWQLWGARCREPNECSTGDVWPSRPHEDYLACDGDFECEVTVCDGVRWNRAWHLRQLFEARQAAIAAVRAAHPDSPLRVYFMVTVNHTEDTYQLNVTRDVLPYLEHPPDLIGLSHWDRDQTVVEALEFIREHTHFSRYRIILIETGHKADADQGDAIRESVGSAMRWGVQAAFVWVWRQSWPGVDLSVIAEDNTPNPALEAIHDLQTEFER